ncbi:MAG: SseB family protein [Actinomycetales bacterium]|nr:SseB family protein [Actinomycetales bacterium]
MRAGGEADSAGIPWAGRAFRPNPDAGDDGAADPAVLAALGAFRDGSAGLPEVVAALHGSRLLLPLVAEAGDEGVGPHGQRVDKTQELALVTVAGPDGRATLPAFTSVATLAAWNREARPIPIASSRVALALGAEQTPLLVIDPGSPSRLVLRRPAFRALATGEAWVPPWDDPEVREAVRGAARAEPAVRAIALEPGDPAADLTGPDLRIALALDPGLDTDALQGLLGRLTAAWAEDALLAERADALGVRLVAATSSPTP